RWGDVPAGPVTPATWQRLEAPWPADAVSRRKAADRARKRIGEYERNVMMRRARAWLEKRPPADPRAAALTRLIRAHAIERDRAKARHAVEDVVTQFLAGDPPEENLT